MYFILQFSILSTQECYFLKITFDLFILLFFVWLLWVKKSSAHIESITKSFNRFNQLEFLCYFTLLLHEIIGDQLSELIESLESFHQSFLLQNMADFIDFLLSCRTIQVNAPISLRILLRTIALGEPNHHLPTSVIIPLSLLLIEILSDMILNLTECPLSWFIKRSLLNRGIWFMVVPRRWRFMGELKRLILIFGRHNCSDYVNIRINDCKSSIECG